MDRRLLTPDWVHQRYIARNYIHSRSTFSFDHQWDSTSAVPQGAASVQLEQEA